MGKFLFLDENSTYFVVRFRWLMIILPYFAWFCFHPIWKPVSLGIIIPKLSEHVESWSHKPIADTKLVSGIFVISWLDKNHVSSAARSHFGSLHPNSLAPKNSSRSNIWAYCHNKTSCAACKKREAESRQTKLQRNLCNFICLHSASFGNFQRNVAGTVAVWHLQFLHWRSCNLHGIVFSESISHVSLLGPWNYPIPWNCWNSMPSGAFRYFATFDFATFRIRQTDWHRRSGGLLCCFLVIFPRGLVWGYQNYQRQEDINDSSWLAVWEAESRQTKLQRNLCNFICLHSASFGNFQRNVAGTVAVWHLQFLHWRSCNLHGIVFSESISHVSLLGPWNYPIPWNCWNSMPSGSFRYFATFDFATFRIRQTDWHRRSGGLLCCFLVIFPRGLVWGYQNYQRQEDINDSSWLAVWEAESRQTKLQRNLCNFICLHSASFGNFQRNVAGTVAVWHLQFLHWRSCNLHGIVFSESISHVSLLGPWNYPIPWNCWNSVPSGSFRYFATFDFATFRIRQTDWHRRSGGLLCCFLVIFPRGLLWGYQNYQRQEDINDSSWLAVWEAESRQTKLQRNLCNFICLHSASFGNFQRNVAGTVAVWHLQFLHWRSCNLHGIVFSESISHVSLLGPWNYPIPWNCWNSMPSGAFRYFATFDFATFRIGQTDWHRRSGGLLCCFLVIFPRGLVWGYQRQEDINDFFVASRLNSNHLIVEISMALGGIRRYWLWILCVSGWNLVSQHGSTNPCDLSRVKNWKDHWILLLAEIQLLWPTRNLLMF